MNPIKPSTPPDLLRPIGPEITDLSVTVIAHQDGSGSDYAIMRRENGTPHYWNGEAFQTGSALTWPHNDTGRADAQAELAYVAQLAEFRVHADRILYRAPRQQSGLGMWFVYSESLDNLAHAKKHIADLNTGLVRAKLNTAPLPLPKPAKGGLVR